MLNAYFLYLISRRLYLMRVPLLPNIVKLIIFLLYNSSIPFQAKIGKGSRFGYGGIGVVIHKRVEVGNNVLIGSNVTIGGRSGKFAVPKIGDDVYVSTGAKILGDIVIGDNCIIGANSVVISDIPSNSVVVGVPGRVIKRNL